MTGHASTETFYASRPMNVTVPTDGAADPYGLVGTVVGGHRIEVLLDANGSGLVYRGASVATRDRVAIKVLRPVGDVDWTALLARFADEMRALPALAEGNADIVALRASGELTAPRTGEVLPFLVYEWIDGTLLGTHLAERRERKMPGRSLEDALDLVETAARALAHAHEAGVVHRDIRPSNLILARLRNGTHLKVLDFGVAQTLGAVPPEYAAPEQISQRGLVGPWTDIRALTLVVLEVMAGGDRPRDPKALVPTLELPKGLVELFLRALAEDPHERPAHAGFFWSSARELSRTHVQSSIALAPTDSDEASDRIKSMRVEIANRQSSTPSPFTGTMLMVGAPNGEIRALDVEETPGSTAPLAMPVPAPASAPVSVVAETPAHIISPHAMSIGLASPLASSIGLGSPQSPVTFPMPASPPAHPMKLPTPQPFSPPAAQSAMPTNLAHVPHGMQRVPNPSIRQPSAPPPPPAETSGSPGFLLGLAVGVSVTVALLAALYWAVLRP